MIRQIYDLFLNFEPFTRHNSTTKNGEQSTFSQT